MAFVPIVMAALGTAATGGVVTGTAAAFIGGGLTAASIGGTVMSAMGQRAEGKAAQSEAEYNAQVSRNNAATALQSAESQTIAEPEKQKGYAVEIAAVPMGKWLQ